MSRFFLQLKYLGKCIVVFSNVAHYATVQRIYLYSVYVRANPTGKTTIRFCFIITYKPEITTTEIISNTRIIKVVVF